MIVRPTFGIRCKLIAIFILIKVIPLIALAWIAWSGIQMLGEGINEKIVKLSGDTQAVIGEVSDIAVQSSIEALDLKSRESIERLTTDTARAVAAFLYERDADILGASRMAPSVKNYKEFLYGKDRTVIDHRPWVMNEAGDAWVPAERAAGDHPIHKAENTYNSKEFHYRPPEDGGVPIKKPLYLEMTFIDLSGKEVVKVSTSDILSHEKQDISDTNNTYCKAENYFDELKKLGPGDIYVSEVIGPHLRSPIIGAYTRQRAEAMGVPFDPESAAYAGKENPVGKRFQGLIRWAAPVVRKGRIVGWVTLALDHTHVMEFTDHLVPTDERYSPISDAGSGNYAFIWDYKDRNISHPRDYFITGYDPETGQPAVPWLEKSRYDDFMESGKAIDEWEQDAPVMVEQSLKKKPSIELTKEGMLGLDCRYLDFAPQCSGWYNLTKDGGSGSFVIFWSGLWKLTTAAAIPYHTGRYADTPRGFGFVTIGANVHEFHKAATETGKKIMAMARDYEGKLAIENQATQTFLENSLRGTAEEITYSTLAMVALVILVAIWMASTLTKKITSMISGIRRFQDGEMEHRLAISSNDEMGQLALVFNEMADGIQSLVADLRQAEQNYRGFFENSVLGMFQSRADGRLLNINQAFAALFGFSTPEEMMEEVKHIGDELYEDSGRREELLRLLREHGKVRDFEYNIRHQDGTLRTLQVSCDWVSDASGHQFMEGTSSDITDRKMAIKALESAKEKAEQLSLMKSNFLSMVSHELRTPLTSIIGFAKLSQKYFQELQECCGQPEVFDGKLSRLSQNTKVIISEGDRLAELINNVLDLAKLEAGRFEWKVEAVNIKEVIQHSLEVTAPLFDEKGLVADTQIEEDIPDIYGDTDRLVQVCINLLSNAVKFTSRGTISCRAYVEDEEVLVRIEDTGVGISEDDADAIFDKFRQLGNTLTGKPQGTGLGLPISKEIIEHHGGRIWHMPNTNGGSIFIFSLPLNTSLRP